jgi:hypothetical protein
MEVKRFWRGDFGLQICNLPRTAILIFCHAAPISRIGIKKERTTDCPARPSAATKSKRIIPTDG